MHATTSDRICSIRLAEKGSGSTLTVIGVYLPCQDLGIDLYCSCLTDLEQLIFESRQLGRSVVMGDFNAHLGSLGGPKGSGNPNQQGFLLHQLVTRSDLYVATLADNASGPSYTYASGETKTTIDYILLNIDAASLTEGCDTLEDNDLNTSDHLPQSVVLQFSSKVRETAEPVITKIN